MILVRRAGRSSRSSRGLALGTPAPPTPAMVRRAARHAVGRDAARPPRRGAPRAPGGRQVPAPGVDGARRRLARAGVRRDRLRGSPVRRHGGVDGRAVAAAVCGRLRRGVAAGRQHDQMQLAALLDPRCAGAASARTLAQKWRQMRLAVALESRWSKDADPRGLPQSGDVPRRADRGGAAAAWIVRQGAARASPGPRRRCWRRFCGAQRAADAVARRAGGLAGRIGSRVSASVAAACDAMRSPPATGAAAGRTRRSGVAPAPAGGAAGLRRGRRVDARRGGAAAAAETLRRHLTAVRARGWDGAVLVVDNASGDVLAYVGVDRRPLAARVRRRRARPPPGGLDAQAVPVRAGARRAAPHAGVAARRLAAGDRGGRRALSAAQLRREFRGLVSVRTSLASSLNVPAVRVLDLVGVEASVDRSGGSASGLVEPGDCYGPALALGSADVTLWEMVGAYRALARGGVWSPMRLTADAPAERRARRCTRPRRRVRGGPRPGRPREPQRHVRPRERAGHAVLDRGEDRHQQGHARQLVRRVLAPLHGRRLGGQLLRRADARRQRRHRRRAGVGRRDARAPPLGAERRAAPAARPVAAPVRFAAGSSRHASTGSCAAPSRPTWPPRPPPHRARIVAPTSGTIIALDPEIPRDLQRVVLEATGPTAGARFTVDGQPVGSGGGLVVWPPVPGRHVVALLDADDREVDRVRIEVRGPGSSRAPRK